MTAPVLGRRAPARRQPVIYILHKHPYERAHLTERAQVLEALRWRVKTERPVRHARGARLFMLQSGLWLEVST